MKIKKCNLCGSTEFKFLYQTRDRMLGLSGKFFLKKCKNCSLAFLDPQPSSFELKKYYPSKKYYAYNKSEKKGIVQILREYLIEHYYSPNLLSFLMSTFIKKVPAMPSYKKNGKILDLGCGTGDTLFLLKKLGWETYGIDMDDNALETGRESGLKNLKLGTYKDLVKYPDNYFDAIRLYHVIEHLDDPFLCISLIKKKLKRNGELIVGTPNIKSLLGFIFKSYWYNLDSPRHLYLFSPGTLKRLIKEQNLKIDKTEFCSAGGIVGSIQYYINDKFNWNLDLIHNFIFVVLFYPLEWILDKFYLGDVFTIRANKK